MPRAFAQTVNFLWGVAWAWCPVFLTIIFTRFIIRAQMTKFWMAVVLAGWAFEAVFLAIVASRAIYQYLERYRHQCQVGKWREEMVGIRATYPMYTHEQLPDPESKTIRLIELLPAEDAAENITINLRVASMIGPQRQPYEAISYCWGDPTEPHPVFCGDGSLLWVTRSLHGALTQLRLKDRSRLLWADAVCINQVDNDEKSWQVRMMADIYRNAERVLICLGEAADHSDVLEQFVPRLLKAKELKDAANDKRPYYQLDAAKIKAYGIPSLSHDHSQYYTFHRVMQRAWFRRIWIIQEVALAREATVYCGCWTMPWSLLQHTWNFLDNDLSIDEHITTYNSRGSGYFLDALMTTVRKITTNTKVPFLQLLSHHSYADATDPRDKVFALMGITDDSEGIQIDYGSPVEIVFRETALSLVAKYANLDILSFASTRLGSSDPPLPSWVPDWRLPIVALPDISESRAGSHSNFQATAGSAYLPITSHDRSRLHLSGYVIDSISVIGPSNLSVSFERRLRKFWELCDDDRAWAEWADICGAFRQKKYQLTGEPLIDVFRQTLCSGLWKEVVTTSEQVSSAEQFELRLQVVGFVKGPVLLNSWLLFRIWSSVLIILSLNLFWALCRFRYVTFDKYWLNTVGRFNAGRRMIKTKQGFIGAACGDMKVGDKVVLLRGGRVPYVLRDTDEDNVYMLVGECYLHGHMRGREWDLNRCHEMWLA